MVNTFEVNKRLRGQIEQLGETIKDKDAEVKELKNKIWELEDLVLKVRCNASKLGDKLNDERKMNSLEVIALSEKYVADLKGKDALIISYLNTLKGMQERVKELEADKFRERSRTGLMEAQIVTRGAAINELEELVNQYMLREIGDCSAVRDSMQQEKIDELESTIRDFRLERDHYRNYFYQLSSVLFYLNRDIKRLGSLVSHNDARALEYYIYLSMVQSIAKVGAIPIRRIEDSLHNLEMEAIARSKG